MAAKYQPVKAGKDSVEVRSISGDKLVHGVSFPVVMGIRSTTSYEKRETPFSLSFPRPAANRSDMKDFHELKVWQKAHQLTLAVYEVTRGFPREEPYNLTSQM